MNSVFKIVGITNCLYLIPLSFHIKDFKKVFRANLLDALHETYHSANKPAGLFVLSTSNLPNEILYVYVANRW